LRADRRARYWRADRRRGDSILGIYVTHLYYVYPRTDDAYVRANVVGVAPHVSGPIIELPVEDNQHVKQGDLLFVVDPRPYQSAADKADADLALTNLQISGLNDAIRAASDVSKAQNDLGQYGAINARRKAAETALYDARLNVQYCYVRAPFDAYMTNLNIAVGQYGNEGGEVMSLVDNRVWYVLANFRENFLDEYPRTSALPQ
jgi:multidrug resistance efflux pump